MLKHYEKILMDAERRAALYIKNQVRDKTSPYYGAIISESNIPDPRTNIFILAQLIELYVNKDSAYYFDSNLYESILLLIDYVKQVQRHDGTFDLNTCNFFSAPDTAFAINAMIPAYRLLKRHVEECGGWEETDSGSIEIKPGCRESRNAAEFIFCEITKIMERAGYGIMNGGFHTPNHRWAIAACLMTLYNIFKVDAFKEKACQYLQEGIDCNEYGEYSERSSGNYNHVNNEQMIILAEETGDESYLEHVKKNLDMMITYIEPDGTVFTGNSTRQDRGRKIYPDIYYNQYLYMAYKFDNALYASIANRIMESIIERGALAPNYLGFMATHPELISYELPSGCTGADNYKAHCSNYKVHYKESGIVRCRKGNLCFTILKDSDYFLHFQVGEIKMSMRILMRYFDKRLFRPREITETGDGYKLPYTAHGWYYLPFENKPETSDWWKMDNSSRGLKEGPDLDIVVAVKETDKGIAVKISANGCDGVPVFVEMSFTEGVIVKGNGFMCEGIQGGAITVTSGEIEISKGIDTMVIGPGFGKVLIGEQQLQEVGKNTGSFNIYFSDVSNFEHIIMLNEK